MSMGSGSRNEALVPPPLKPYVPRLLAYARSHGTETVTLERAPGAAISPRRVESAHAEVAGALLGLVHSQRGVAFGSLDAKYVFPSQQSAFTARWDVAMRLLRTCDDTLARDTDAWARPRLRRLPATLEPRLVHGDYGAANLLWTEPGRVAIVDWEHARYGDPLEDWAKIRLGSQFADPNSFGTHRAVLNALRKAWRGVAPDLAARRVPPLYLAYFAATLGVFFRDRAGRLKWLSQTVR